VLKFLTVFFLFFTIFCKGQESEIVSKLATISQQLNWKESDFYELEPILQNKKIVALGEATHGTKEFEELYSNLIRFSIEKLGFTAIAFEADFMSSRAINDYVTLKVDSIDYRKASGFPMTKERRSMFEWMREWNEGLDQGKRQAEIFGLEVRNLRRAMECITSYCSKAGINASAIQPFLTVDISKTDKPVLEEGVAFLEELLATKDSLFAEIERHLVTMALQNINHQHRTSTAFKKNKYLGIRDRSMFENTSWVLENTSHENLMIWAHSAHIAKSDIFGAPPTGEYLYDRYKDAYLAIGSTFGSGYVNLFVKKDGQYKFGKKYFPLPTGDFYEYYFNKIKPSPFFVDLQKASTDELLNKFFNQKRKFRFIGGTADAKDNEKVKLSQLFDVVIYVPTSTLIFEN